MNRRLLQAAFCAGVLSLLSACGEQDPRPSFSTSDLYIFGDSLSDTGNARLSTAGLYPDKNYHEGRFSNGPNYADQLAEKLATEIKPSRSFGSNYAFGGARSLEVNAQVFNYGENVGATAKEGATYVVWSGGNDLLQILESEDPSTDIDTAISHIENAVRQLADMGAMKIFVPNQPNMARLPRFISLEEQSPGIGTIVQGLTIEFNTDLAAMLTRIATEDGIATISFDIFSLIENIAADMDSYSIGNVTERCYERDYTELELTGNETICPDSDSYLFWDDVHPSHAAHSIIADAFYTAITEG